MSDFSSATVAVRASTCSLLWLTSDGPSGPEVVAAFGWSQLRKGVAKSAPLGNRMGMLSETPLGLASSSIVAARRRGCALHVEMGDSAVLNAA
jgi:hypothetical protein